MRKLTTAEICSHCGWPMDEAEDCFCAGCGRCLRQLRVKQGDKTHTLFFPSHDSHDLELVNVGDHELSIDVMWEFVGLDGLMALIDGSVSPRVSFLPKESKKVEIRFSADALPSHGSGVLRIATGSISPPLDIALLCSPQPRFYFRINGKMVRDNRVEVISSQPEQPELDFKIELQSAPLARWEAFNFYPEADAAQCFPLPADLALPLDITGEKGLAFRIQPELGPYLEEPATPVKAEFRFAHCPPVRIDIEIFKAAQIRHRQDKYLIDKEAVVKGATTPIQIKVELKNDGGLPAEVLSIRSLNPAWLYLLNTPEDRLLSPGQDYDGTFYIRIDPRQMEQAGHSGDGKIEVSYVSGERSEILQQILNIPIETRDPATLSHAMAIDFGNSSTCAAGFGKRNQLAVISLDPTFSKVLEFPTIIEFARFTPENVQETGAGFRYGVMLEKNRYASADNYLHRIWAFKSGIGHDAAKDVTRIDIENKASRAFSFETLCRFYLQEILRRFEEYSGSRAKEVVITYPASFSRKQIDKLRDVASAAMPAMQVTAEISEPEALALNYFRGGNSIPKGEDLTFAVFDFGGGTTDISIGSVQADGFYQTITIFVSMGLDWLGGEALTYRLARDIYAKACEHFQPADPLFPKHYADVFTISGAERQKLANYMNLMETAEGIKTNKDGQLDTLLNSGELSIPVKSFYARRGDGPQFCLVDYTRKDFDRVAKEKISQGIGKLSDIFNHLKQYRITKAPKPDFVILGGNSARLPLVKEMLMERLDLGEEAVFFDPRDAKTAVAKGAAHYGRLRRAPDANIIFDNAPRLKFPLGIIDWEDQFKVLFPAGHKIGDDQAIPYRFSRITDQTELVLYWNPDPSDMNGHSGAIRLAATHSLARHSTQTPQPVSFAMRLTDQGIELCKDVPAETRGARNDGDNAIESEIIPIDF